MLLPDISPFPRIPCSISLIRSQGGFAQCRVLRGWLLSCNISRVPELSQVPSLEFPVSMSRWHCRCLLPILTTWKDNNRSFSSLLPGMHRGDVCFCKNSNGSDFLIKYGQKAKIFKSCFGYTSNNSHFLTIAIK